MHVEPDMIHGKIGLYFIIAINMLITKAAKKVMQRQLLHVAWIASMSDQKITLDREAYISRNEY